jgi:glycosyltransferase involved in cell wall biosynthesis
MKVLILDGQLFQTGAWHRGMGKYMLQVIKKISETKPDYELAILFNDTIPTDSIRFETITYLAPGFKHLHVRLPVVHKGNGGEKAYIAQLDNYLNSVYKSDDTVSFMLTSLFMFDVYAQFPVRANEKTIIFYDLIPLLNWKELGGYFPPEVYMKRFIQINDADTIFCISKTTQDDLISIFGLSSEKTVNINGGFTDHHHEAEKPKNFIVPGKYVLFPTGDLPHKNNELVFAAFRDVVAKDKSVHLLVTSRFNGSTREKLLAICSENVIFTGNVTDEELQYLYENAAIILFGSKYEGLGLPVLDAVFHNKPVVASRISVFTEMSPDAFYFFDVDNSFEASDTILSALGREGFSQKQLLYTEILSRYDWRRVAEEIVSHITFTKSPRTILDQPLKKKRIAFVSPNPGINPNVYGLGERIYFSLISLGVKVDYYFDSEGKSHQQMIRPTFVDFMNDTGVFDIKRLTIAKYKDYDAIFYAVDEMALSFKLGRTMAVLPGYSFLDETLSKRNIMHKIVTKFELGHNEIGITNESMHLTERAVKYIEQCLSEAKENDLSTLLKSNKSLATKKLWIKRKLEE